MFRTPLARACRAVVVVAAVTPLVVTAIVWLMWRFGAQPSVPEPTHPQGGQVSRAFAANGEEIGQFRQFEQNLPVKPADIPLRLKQAMIAAEDESFYSHGGVDFRGVVRAAKADLLAQDFSQGASTITQQYVRNAYTGRERTVGRKLREVVVARQVDRQLPKDEILFKYLSTIYLGEGAYGVGAASENYFRKPVSQLSLSEAALLAGLVPAPSRYEPRGNPSLAEEKRRVVLDKMLDQGYITPEEHSTASAQRIWMVPNVPPNRPATVIHPPQQLDPKYPYFMDYLRRYLVARYGPETVFKGGLEIHTTLDPRMQAAAEGAIAASLAGTSPPLEMALTAVQPETGFVRAMVGGRDFNAPGGQANLALGGCTRPPERFKDKVDVPATCWDEKSRVVGGGGSGRQAGSAWKPFVLAAALNKGMPESKVYSAPSSYRFKGCTGDQGCTIQNYEGSGGGSANLRSATARSINTVYAQMIRDVGVKETADMAKKLGITSAWVATPEIQGPSYAIGTQEVSPLDMASAFGVFANHGRRNPATPVEWMKARGKILEDNRRRAPERVLDEGVANSVTDILKGVITGGTGTKADIGRPAAGKTGTAQEWRDAWFVGYTPQLSAAVWIGNRDRPTSLFGVKGVGRVTGGSIPAETWKGFMLEALKDVPPTDFTGVTTLPPPPPPVNPPPVRTPTSQRPPVTSYRPYDDAYPPLPDYYYPPPDSYYIPPPTTTTSRSSPTIRRSGTEGGRPTSTTTGRTQAG